MNLSDPIQFARVYEEQHRSVAATAFRVLGDHARAQDVMQDVFVRVWRNPGKFDQRRGEIGSYLRLMARSRAVDVWREGQAAGRATDRLKLVVSRDATSDDDRPDVVVERTSQASAVRAAMAGLPERQREAVALAYWGGLTVDEIAQRAEVPLGTAKSRIRLGLAKLRTEYDGLQGAPAAA